MYVLRFLPVYLKDVPGLRWESLNKLSLCIFYGAYVKKKKRLANYHILFI